MTDSQTMEQYEGTIQQHMARGESFTLGAYRHLTHLNGGLSTIGYGAALIVYRVQDGQLQAGSARKGALFTPVTQDLSTVLSHIGKERVEACARELEGRLQATQ